jgi:hypothetical protein
MDKPFDRVTFFDREKPISTDWNRFQGQADRTLRDVMAAVLAGRATDSSYAAIPRSGFLPNGFRVLANNPNAMSVIVYPGIGFKFDVADVPDNIGLPEVPAMFGVTDLSYFKPLVLMTPQIFAVPTAPPATNSRIDIIEVRQDRYFTDVDAARRQLVRTGPESAQFDPVAAYKTLSWVLDGKVGSVQAPADSTEPLSYKIGVAANPGVAPATTAGYVKLAEIRVGTAVTVIEENKIIDRRRYLGPGGIVRGSARFRVEWNAGAPIITLRSNTFPPDVQVGAKAFGTPQRAALQWHILAGEATEVTATAQVTPYVSTFGAGQGIISFSSPYLAGGVEYIQDVDAGLQTSMAASTPALAGALGAKVITGLVEARYIDNVPTVNITSGLLEDVEIQISADIAYT